jgi:RNA polymerase sigma-70 factor, ECF subfamily
MTGERSRRGEFDAEATQAVPTAGVDRSAAVSLAFATYHEELLSFLRRATRNEATAEDLLQEAYLRLTREVEAGRPPDNVRAWLYRVASNLSVSGARRRLTALSWLTRNGRAEVDRAVDDSPEGGVLRSERRSELLAALDKLPPEARTALLLSAQGFSGLEIAEAIGRSHGATRSLMTRARLAVRLDLEQTEAFS